MSRLIAITYFTSATLFGFGITSTNLVNWFRLCRYEMREDKELFKKSPFFMRIFHPYVGFFYGILGGIPPAFIKGMFYGAIFPIGVYAIYNDRKHGFKKHFHTMLFYDRYKNRYENMKIS